MIIMSKIYSFLEEMKEKLSQIEGVKTLKIGMERGIGSKDACFIRLVPEINSKVKEGAGAQCNQDGSGGYDEMVVQVIYGFDLKNQELEKLYDQFYDLEEEIRSVLLTKYKTAGYLRFIHTVTDEDRLANLKSAISRFKIVGIR